MIIHRSNRAELLVEALAEVIDTPLDSWTSAETIIVQGRGMERWLAMHLAVQDGVCAHTRFPFPRTFLDESISATLGTTEVESAFHLDRLKWAVAAILPDLLGKPSFQTVRRHVVDQPPRRLMQLSDRIAGCLDRYLVYRPELITRWERGAPDDSESKHATWQRELWCALVERYGRDHLVTRIMAMKEHLQANPRAASKLPPRACLFGVNSLPPLYMEAFQTLAAHMQIHLFALSPSPEWYADAPAPRETPDPSADSPSVTGHLVTEPHSLIDSLGRMSRDFLNLLADRVEDVTAGDRYRSPEPDSLLTNLQYCLFHLSRPDRSPTTRDSSVTVHSCHSPMREVEVLRDQLLACLDDDTSLRPEEICVLSPDIDTYAPYVSAVFGADHRLPYRIADRALRRSGVVIDGFFRVLDVAQGRVRKSEVLDLLHLDPIRERFGIAQEDLSALQEMVSDVHIRWGIDREHRSQEGQSASEENTWRLGLDRLLLGYAMGKAIPFGDALPQETTGQASTGLLGQLAEFAETLFGLRNELMTPRSPLEWLRVLERCREQLFSESPSHASQYEELRRAFQHMARCAAAAGFDGVLPLSCIHERLEAILGYERSTAPFLTGGITFCQFVPMRSIPFRVLALIGMNHDGFPRQDRPATFDLLAEAPRRGDRSLRDEDRGVFLEALLSARQRLIITYVGQSLRDSAVIPPSVAVSELLDALGTINPGEEELIVRHPLQPFSPRYFQDNRGPLFSYDDAAAAGAAQLASGAPDISPFVDGVLPPRGNQEPILEVSLEELEAFFRNPSRAYIHALGFRLGRDAPEVDDRQPIAIDFLEQWKIGTELLEQHLKRPGPLTPNEGEKVWKELMLTGRLPPSQLGEYSFRQIEPSVRALVARAAPLLEEPKRAPRPIALDIHPFRIVGALTAAREGLVYAQYARAGDTRDLSVWIRHLVWNAVADDSDPRRSTLVARTEKGVDTFVFSPVARPKEQLTNLVALYRAGLVKPLPLFRYASRKYADRRRATDDDSDALRVARGQFGAFEDVTPDLPGQTDSSDPYVRRLFRFSDPLNDAESGPDGWLPFRAAARAVYDPMLDHLERDER